MTIPAHDDLMLPFLQILSDGKEHKITEIRDILAKEFNLSNDEIAEKIPSGCRKFAGRVGWARTYLKGARLIESTQRAHFIINERGEKALKDKPENILQYLKQYPEYLEFMGINKKDEQVNKIEVDENTQTPTEILDQAQIQYNENIQRELLSRLKQVDPVRFEQIVLTLMEKMNYGVGKMTKLSHDGGIDGIINEDVLGLEKIYLQAKRYSDNKVNEKEMQNFAGALGCSSVRKGVFITTSYFDERAKRKAESLQGKVIRLVDGKELTQLMIDHNVGVQIKSKIEIKKIDEDFFDDEE